MGHTRTSRGCFEENFGTSKSDRETWYFVGGGEEAPMNSPLNSRMNYFLLIFPNFDEPKVEVCLR